MEGCHVRLAKWHCRETETKQIVCFISILGHECATQHITALLVWAHCEGIGKSRFVCSFCSSQSVTMAMAKQFASIARMHPKEQVERKRVE